MAKTLKERAAEQLKAVRASSDRALHSARLGARALGRRASSAASRQRQGFCARTAAPRTDRDVLDMTNRALRRAFVGIERPAEQITDAASAIRIGKSLHTFPGRDDAARRARLAGEAALHVGYALESGDQNEWNEAAEYADDALDVGLETKDE